MTAASYVWIPLAEWDERPDDVLVQEGDAIYLARWRDGVWYDVEGHVLVPSAWMPIVKSASTTEKYG